MAFVNNTEKPFKGFSIFQVDADSFPKVDLGKKEMMIEQNKRFCELDSKYRKEILESISNDNCPFFPDFSEGNNYVDTSVPVKLGINGFTTLKDTLYIMCKIKQSQLGADTPEFVTNEMIERALKDNVDTGIIETERANGVPTIMAIRKDPKDDKSEILNFKIVTYYNICQLKNPQYFREYLQKRFLQERHNRMNYVKEKYGDKAFAMKEMSSYPEYKGLYNPKPLICESKNNDPAEIMSQIITAGTLGRPLIMSKVEMYSLKNGLTNILTKNITPKSRVVADFGRKVGSYVKYTREEMRKNNAKESDIVYDIGR